MGTHRLVQIMGKVAKGAVWPFFPAVESFEQVIDRLVAERKVFNFATPSFEDWICTPNLETYQEYQERRLPSTRNTSTTPDPDKKES